MRLYPNSRKDIKEHICVKICLYQTLYTIWNPKKIKSPRSFILKVLSSCFLNKVILE